MTDQQLELETEHSEEQRGRRRSGRRRGRRRLWLGALLGAIGIIFVLGVLAAPPSIAARRSLFQAKDAVLLGRDHLLAGDVEEAAEAFREAEEAFADAGSDIDNPVLRIAGFVPLLGRTPDSLRDLSEAGGLVSRAGRILAETGEDLPGQVAALAPRDGVIPVDQLRELSPTLTRVGDLVRRADGLMEASPGTWLLAPIVEPRSEFMRQLDDTRRMADSAEGLVRTLPTFLGADEPKTYFLGAQNPAELRGTGGFIGAFTIMTAKDGRIELGTFRSVQTLGGLGPDEVEAPNPDFADRYRPYGGTGFWQNINMTPDFPSAATAIERLYEAVEGKPLDGVVVADPEFLSKLLGVTGPAEVPAAETTVDEETVVPFVTNEAYADIGNEARKRLLGRVAESVMKEFLGQSASDNPAAAGRALVEAGAAGHLLLHSTDPETQGSFEKARVSGGLLSPPGDYLSLVANNAGGNKIDFYADRAIDYRVRLDPGGAAYGRATASFENHAPRKGQPAYVIGPHDDVSKAGENVMITSMYCASSCELEGFARGGEAEEIGLGQELGHTVIDKPISIPSGGSEELEYAWSVPDVWEGDDRSGSYRLTFQGQTSIRPTRLSLEVVAPEGMEITRADSEMTVDGNQAVWEGEAEDLMTFEVEFARPLSSRLWRGVLDFLNTPLF